MDSRERSSVNAVVKKLANNNNNNKKKKKKKKKKEEEEEEEEEQKEAQEIGAGAKTIQTISLLRSARIL